MPLRLPIDVIMPAYNAAPYLGEALASVSAQTRAVSEIIVIDDGSTDDTAAIARSFGATVLSVSNGGVAAARNVGIRASKAPFVALLDADDRWRPDRIEAQWAVHEARPDVLLVASDYVALADGNPGDPILVGHELLRAAVREPILKGSYLVKRGVLLTVVAARNFLLPSSMLLDRRLFDEYGVFYLPRERLPETDAILVGEDYEWLLRALRYTDVAFVDRVLVDYRKVSTSLSARRGRIRYGDVILSRLVSASPDLYAIGAADLLRGLRPKMLLESAIAHLRVGELSLASARFAEVALQLPQPKRAAASLAAWLLDRNALNRFLRPLVVLRRPSWTRPHKKRS